MKANAISAADRQRMAKICKAEQPPADALGGLHVAGAAVREKEEITFDSLGRHSKNDGSQYASGRLRDFW